MQRELRLVLDDIESKMFNKEAIVEMARVDCSDWERGKIQGKIELLSEIRRMLSEANSIR